jgi:hypothetical protein
MKKIKVRVDGRWTSYTYAKQNNETFAVGLSRAGGWVERERLGGVI